MNTSVPKEKIFDYEKWASHLVDLKNKYQKNSPYPHIVLENFLDEESLNRAFADFDVLNKNEAWINYVHFNENKKGFNKINVLPPHLQSVVRQLNSSDFVRFLSDLSGIDNLLVDDSYEGGGIHQSTTGGFLNIHADFTVHPHHRNWQRRVNVILYLNKSWPAAWGGDLELWNKEMTVCEVKVAPAFNRCIIFNTNAYSFHGHPEPMTCPSDRYRRSIAIYYYTKEENPYKRATNYQARPDDGAKKILIKIDNFMLAVYTIMKGILGSNDGVVSHILRMLKKWKK